MQALEPNTSMNDDTYMEGHGFFTSSDVSNSFLTILQNNFQGALSGCEGCKSNHTQHPRLAGVGN